MLLLVGSIASGQLLAVDSYWWWAAIGGGLLLVVGCYQ